jgi:hypothetical protein
MVSFLKGTLGKSAAGFKFFTFLLKKVSVCYGAPSRRQNHSQTDSFFLYFFEVFFAFVAFFAGAFFAVFFAGIIFPSLYYKLYSFFKFCQVDTLYIVYFFLTVRYRNRAIYGVFFLRGTLGNLGVRHLFNIEK